LARPATGHVQALVARIDTIRSSATNRFSSEAFDRLDL